MASITKSKNRDGSTSYVAQVRLKGYKPVGKSFAVRKEAERWAAALETELKRQRERGGVRGDVTQLTLAQLANEYLDDPEVKAMRYYSSLQPLTLWWVSNYGAERVLGFNVLKIREARNRLSPGRAPATINRYLAAMRSAWNWGRSQGLLPQDLGWPSRIMLTEPSGRTRFLSDAELKRLLSAARQYSHAMYVAILVSIGCGVRQSELLRLGWADIDLDRQRLTVQLSKNGESRAVYLPQSAVDALRELKRAPLVGTSVFIGPSGQTLTQGALEARWSTIRKNAGLNDFRWHDLRHSCASFLAQEGANLLEIGAVLGHKSPSMTKRYSHLIEGKPVTGHTKLDQMLSKA